MMIEPRRNSRHFGRFLLQFRLHWFWHYHPALCCLWDTTTGGKVIRVHQVFLVLLLSLFPPCSQIWFIVSEQCFSVFSSISVAAPSYLSLSFDCHLIKKFHFLPKMETSPSSPRINQTRGGEEWKCENRNSRGREMRNARGKISFQNVWVLVRGFGWWGNIGVVGA